MGRGLIKVFAFMKALLSVIGVALLVWNSAVAQVTVKIELPQQQFLPGESLPLAVRITNRSGQPLHLGEDAKWLAFYITGANNSVVSQLSEPQVVGEFDLESLQMGTKRVDIASCFNLKREGTYGVVAVIHIKQWNVDVSSPVQSFDIIEGAKLWSQSFGIPAPAGVTNALPEMRKYTLEQANYLKSQLQMYVMVTDDTGRRIFKTRSVGPMVSFSQPEAQLDRQNRLHVIYQSGARVFTYTVVDPDGEFVRQENLDYLDTRPRLQTDDAGDVAVLGGVRRVKPDNLPLLQMPTPIVAPSEVPATATAPVQAPARVSPLLPPKSRR
jgi:hypothetical protein